MTIKRIPDDIAAKPAQRMRFEAVIFMLRSLLFPLTTVLWRLVFMFLSFLAIPRFALFVHRDAPVDVSRRPARVLLHKRAWVLVCEWNPATKRGLVQRLPCRRSHSLLYLPRAQVRVHRTGARPCSTRQAVHVHPASG